MNRTETTKELSRLTEKYMNKYNDQRIYTAKEVTFDYATNHSLRVDYMKFVPRNNTPSGIEKGDFYCYEVKSCVDDFRSKNGHNFIGDLNYYVMPAEVFEAVKNEIPYGVGIVCPCDDLGGRSLKVLKKAKRKDRTRSCSEMLFMMFRSSNRDVLKYKNSLGY